MLATQIVRLSNSWGEFKNHLKQITEKEKGDCFEALTKYFLQIHPTYATKLKNVWLLREVPHQVKKQLSTHFRKFGRVFLVFFKSFRLPDEAGWPLPLAQRSAQEFSSGHLWYIST